MTRTSTTKETAFVNGYSFSLTQLTITRYYRMIVYSIIESVMCVTTEMNLDKSVFAP